VALLTLDDAKAQLNITSTANDAELTAYVNSVDPVIERVIGPVTPREVTEVQDLPRTGAACMVLRTTPVIELTTVEPLLAGVPAVDVDGLVLDGDTGVVQRFDCRLLRGPLRVTYQAGRAEVPATVNLAARMLVQHLWRTQNRASPGLAGGGEDYSVSDPIPGMGYAVPNRVLELLEPYKLAPGVA
jgi:hypothetical protein